ncbi:MAG: hypothetical protein WKG00_20785, partial [Polyangiaceae bacterium]
MARYLRAAQRRHPHPHQAIEQPCGSARPDLASRLRFGGHHAHLDHARLVVADGAHLAELQRAQQHRLHVQRQLADLVEEERAAVGALEGAAPRVDGATEGAAPVAEELAGHQLARDGAAVDDHERPGGHGRAFVERARHQLLADAGLALDQHRGQRPFESGEDTEEAADGERGADDVAVDRPLELRHLRERVVVGLDGHGDRADLDAPAEREHHLLDALAVGVGAVPAAE